MEAFCGYIADEVKACKVLEMIGRFGLTVGQSSLGVCAAGSFVTSAVGCWVVCAVEAAEEAGSFVALFAHAERERASAAAAKIAIYFFIAVSPFCLFIYYI